MERGPGRDLIFELPNRSLSSNFPKVTGQAQPTALRRLQRDLQHLNQEPIPGIIAVPTEENILEWHYIIEGSPDTVYEGGYFHGKLVFQPDFPWKPPAICMITPNGRFRTNMRLCLSISDYHPESWNPGWTVTSILIGLHSFMNEDTHAAGVVNEPNSTRLEYAANSMEYNIKNPEFIRMFPEIVHKYQNGEPIVFPSSKRPSVPECITITSNEDTDSNDPICRTSRKRDGEDLISHGGKKIVHPVEVIDLTDD